MLKTYQDGLADAANLLVQTAEDYESGFNRRRDEILRATQCRQLGLDALKRSLVEDEIKAKLLRGQAGHILMLTGR